MHVEVSNFLFSIFFLLQFLVIIIAAACCKDRVLVGGANGEFATSDDGGETWKQQFVETGYKITCIIETDNGNLIVGTTIGSFISKNRGTIWTKFLNFQTDSAFIIGNNVYLEYYDVSEQSSFVMNSTDQGETWSTGAALPWNNYYRNIYAMGQRFYTGWNSGLLFSDDFFAHSTAMDTTTGLGGKNVSALGGDGHSVYVGFNADGAPLTISDNGFVSMGTVFLDSNGKNNGIQSLASACRTTYASLRNVGVAVTRDVFSTWSIKTMANGLASNDTLVVTTGSCDFVYAATLNGLSISRDSGQTWITKTTMNGLPTNKLTAAFVKPAVGSGCQFGQSAKSSQ